jgi:6-phosphogluconolactonase
VASLRVNDQSCPRSFITDDEDALAAAAADHIASLIAGSIAARRTACVCLTGGRTPRRTYERLAGVAGAGLDWAAVHVFWGDERHVPPDHPDSNYRMAVESFLSHVPVVPQVHRMRGENPDAEGAAREYEERLRSGFAAAGRSDLTFDVMLLGVGADAHIASLFPDSPLPDANEVRVAAVQGLSPGTWRITLTPRAVLDARAFVVMVAGQEKAEAVHAALEGPEDVGHIPAQLLRQAGDRVAWFIDRAAASALRATRDRRAT